MGVRGDTFFDFLKENSLFLDKYKCVFAPLQKSADAHARVNN